MGIQGPAPISTHALREEGDYVLVSAASARKISTHALREEGDCVVDVLHGVIHISTHALREEGDAVRCTPFSRPSRFLPTPSARRATVPPRASASRMCYFYPRPPRGGRRVEFITLCRHQIISTHALREEGDGDGQVVHINIDQFLPTPSARRAT